MEQKPVAFQELREQYINSSKRKLEQIEALLSRLEKDPDNREALADLHRQFHGFFGSGSTYGFPAITTAGLQGEKLCDSLLSQPDPISKEQLESLKKLHEDLKVAFSNVPTTSWSPPKEAEVPPAKVNTIYVVDNDRDVADLLVRLIEREGMIARRFSTKEKAVGAIEQQIPDGMIIDIHLPDGTGYELVEYLRGLPGGDNPAVLMVSVVAGFLDKVEAIRCGADGYFEKVVDWESLLRRLQHLLDRESTEPSRILSMEDDPEQSAFVKAVLESAGYSVRISEDPRRFEAELVQFHPDLVLMDVVLPEISGYDLVRYIRQDEKYAILPVLFLTTQSQLQAKIEMVKAGADDYLLKPVSPGLLLSTVAARLERARFLQSLLDKDGLTRLLTHTAFLERAKVTLNQKTRNTKKSAAMAMIDLDHFKLVNDLYGHLMGDRVLASLAALLRRRLRQSDVIGRYGGEEFAVIIDDLQEKEAVRLIERLLEEFAQIVHRTPDGRLFRVTFSAGVSMLAPKMSLDRWRQTADGMLYMAKSQGRNCVKSPASQINA